MKNKIPTVKEFRIKQNLLPDLALLRCTDGITLNCNERVEKQKLEFAIEQLNKLDFSLKEKYTDLTYLQKEFVGKMREQHIRNKKAGISVAKEEIRRDIKELEQKLSEL